MDEASFRSWLESQRGVVRTEVIDDDLLDILVKEESTVVSSFGTPVDNSGLRDCIARDTVFLAFVDGTFWQPPTRTMVMKNSEGEIVGHDISKSQILEYMKRDVMFLSDDFIMYPDVEMTDSPVMEMLSQEYSGEDKSLPADTEAVLWFPSPSSSGIIADRYGQELGTLATALIGINVH